ncbi:MAG: DNA methyltransferase [Limnoraphis sp.]
MASDRELYQHKEWLGLLQPVGLVVSPSALNKHQAEVNRYRAISLQPRLQGVVSTAAVPGRIPADTAWLEDFPAFAEQVLEWLPSDLQTPPETLEHALPDYGETLRPTYAVADPDSKEWIMLVQTVKPGLPLDDIDPETATGQGWKATLQAKFERLLRETQIPIGLLSNGLDIRLVYAPRGESSGHLTFPVQAMTEVPGRLILTALEMLIGNDRLFNLPSDRRLPKILADSRNDQAEVSTKLASQVLDALWELLRGFQSADADVNGELLREAQTDTQHLYGGLIATLMRLVFLLYAEDEGLMPDDAIYQRNYAVSGLYQQLREDAGLYPDTMDQRYGAWASLLSLFRLVYDGGGTTQEYLPARHGQLFDPDEFPFLEGRPRDSSFQIYGKIQVPRIPDGVIFRILHKLLILDAERLSYRALDVEQIGSVYEAIMGYEVEVAEGLSIGVNPKDVVINVEAILRTKSKDRAKFLQNEAECKLTGKGLTELKAAKTPEEIVAALDRKVSARTPNLLPKGCLYLQPGEERRRTGSHYTPRKLTQPIVETTLRPVLEGLGEHPTAESILALKVCDLAMGSAAFLVEACRQLAEKLVAAWDYHGLPEDFNRPSVEPLLLARRLVAQRCLYGVDKNPFAVNLAKLSLWLVTLAKDMPFTFVDHALKCGDSLVGLTQQEIGSFGKDPIADLPLIQLIQEKVDRAKSLRSQIQALDTRSNADAENKSTQLRNADRELQDFRLVGDIAIAAFFDSVGKSKKAATELQLSYQSAVRQWREKHYQPDNEFYPKLTSISNSLRFPNVQSSLPPLPPNIQSSLPPLPPNSGGNELRDLGGGNLEGNNREKSITPFNWEIEFPEVFDRENPGFDAIIGNPPFLGGKKISGNFGDAYKEWLTVVNPESNSNSDIVAHFFRRAFTIIRKQGTFGLIATNTIAQGDTRSSGLRFICNNGGMIYNATRRYRWPGLAAVVVSIVHIIKVKS